MEIRKIAVIGAGLMGSGIAQVAAQSGYDVNLMDVEQRFIDKGISGIEKNLNRLAGKGKMDPARSKDRAGPHQDVPVRGRSGSRRGCDH